MWTEKRSALLWGKRRTMLYADNTPYPQVLMIPNNGREVAGTSEAVLVLHSTTENREKYEITAVIASNGGLYHPVAISLPNGPETGVSALASGSYEYELTQDGRMLSSGCIQIGEYKPATRQADGGRVTFSQGK